MEYAFLYTLTFRAIRNTQTYKTQIVLFISLFIIFLYAILDELHQMFVPTREGTLRDVIIDVIGGILAWIFLVNIPHILPKKLRNLAGNLEII